MYMGFSGSTQHSIKVHNVEWCIAKEVVRLTTVTQWSRDLGMAEGRGKQKNVVVFNLVILLSVLNFNLKNLRPGRGDF